MSWKQVLTEQHGDFEAVAGANSKPHGSKRKLSEVGVVEQLLYGDSI